MTKSVSSARNEIILKVMTHYRSYLVFPLILILLVPLPSVCSDSVFPTDFETETILSDIYASDRAREVYEAVSVRLYKEYVRELSEIGPRPVGSDNNIEAKKWIMNKLEEVSNGKIQTETLGPSDSVIGKLSGTYSSNGPSVVIGGHYDSVEGAPGANDDASGVATAIELARVLSSYTWPLDIYFCAWNAEEIGLIGSDEVADIFREREVDVLIYFNIDMLLFPDAVVPQNQKVILGYDSSVRYHSSAMWANLVQVMNHNYGNLVATKVPSSEIPFWTRSDHYSFIRNGYRNVLNIYESGIAKDTAYHKPSDTWDNPAYDYGIAAEAVAAMGSAIAFVLGGTHRQRVLERHEALIGMNSVKPILVEITTGTNITTKTIWEGLGEININLIAPNGQEIQANQLNHFTERVEATFPAPLIGTYKVLVKNELGNAVNYDIVLEYDSDIEGNGIRDKDEIWNNAFHSDYDNDGVNDAEDPNEYVDLRQLDSDNDSISDYDEIYVYETDHLSSDTDSDSIPDAWEISRGLDPKENDAKLDFDYDGLVNQYEYLAGTDPFLRDSDLDGMYDGWEYYYGLDPLFDDSQEDLDDDGWTNIYELHHGHDPTVADSPFVTIVPILQIYGILGMLFAFLVVFRRLKS
ncbi:MAG: hypothetical protein BAJATHORv1_30384 [Candidatus Thorarchaeota archaeon]|nr:MAG: hypothetical protein BAJATHORv1_30384 [Candidatus Thorarchaeota archaeon]